MVNAQQEKYYIVEHMDDGLFDWSFQEYLQIIQYLKNDKQSYLIFSNVETFLSSNSNQDEYKQFEERIKILKENKDNKIKLFLQNKLKTYWDDQKRAFILSDDIIIGFQQICLLDMNGTINLNPSDQSIFTCFLFGGILGDHPSRDRTKELRVIGFQQRQLGSVQMTTDTAVLTTKLIIENQFNYDDIPFVNEPEFTNGNQQQNQNQDLNQDSFKETVQMCGFRYISQSLNLQNLQIDTSDQSLRNQIYIPNKIRDELMYDQLDFSKWDLDNNNNQ